VGVHHSLAETDPAAYLPELTTSLNNLSIKRRRRRSRRRAAGLADPGRATGARGLALGLSCSSAACSAGSAGSRKGWRGLAGRRLRYRRHDRWPARHPWGSKGPTVNCLDLSLVGRNRPSAHKHSISCRIECPYVDSDTWS
jgi:hypothetical protein